ncbi:hypothetical protein ABZ671_01155 [Micromonospora sp. NPDC006766]|uniref:hypothetical protein n=1 Tax=Micromonospora sp. NPDC006766 TaxID=3154778 RepID=UPI0033F7810F
MTVTADFTAMQTAVGYNLVALLVEAGSTTNAARQITAHAIRAYLGYAPMPAPVVADDLADVTGEQRGIAVEFGMGLIAAARAAGRASCPDAGPALDHAAAALRLALAHPAPAGPHQATAS